MHTRIGFIITSLLVMFTPLPGQARSPADPVYNWVITDDSPSLDRSSMYLANGNLEAGIRYARRALSRSRSPYAETIANHNLCLALQLAGEPGAAREHCQKVIGGILPAVPLTKVRDGLYRISKQAHTNSLTLATLLISNLDGVNGVAVAGAGDPAGRD